jgi:membrane carboxypeptidase/penicillin-binding protein
MPVQSFNLYTGKGYAGQEAITNTSNTVITGRAEEDIAFGVALARGVESDKGVKLGNAAGSAFAIALREVNHEADTRPSDGSTSYKEGDSVSIIREGYVYVQLENRAAVAGSFVGINDTTGAIEGDDDSAGVTLSTNVRAEESGQPGDVIKVRIDVSH